MALRVPCSEGPSTTTLVSEALDPWALMAAEPAWEPTRVMELGTDWTPEVSRAVHDLDRPISPD